MVKNIFLQWAIALVMFIVTCIPGWGVIALSWQFAPSHPVIVAIADLLWVIAFTMFLPISLHWFRVVTTGSMTAIMAATLYMMYLNTPYLFNLWGVWPAWMWVVVVAGVDIGWLLVSTRLWRKVQGTLPVVQNNTNFGEEEHQHDHVQP